MRIGMFARGLPANITGGMEVHTRDLIKGLIKRGHEIALITLITSSHPSGSIEFIEKGLTDNIIFTGRIPDNNMPVYYNLGKVLTLYEPFGLVACEAMACCKPIIASRTGGLTDIVDNRTDGILIEKGNLKELRENILMILKDDSMATKAWSQC
jgi:hypothetical protein